MRSSAIFIRLQEGRTMEQTRIGSIRSFIWVLFLCLGAIPAYAQTAQEIARKAFISTVLLVMEDANGQPLSLGSGFFVRDGEVASNLHIIEGTARGYAKIIGQETKYDIVGITGVDHERDSSFSKSLLLVQEQLPLAIVIPFKSEKQFMLLEILRGWKALFHRA